LQRDLGTLAAEAIPDFNFARVPGALLPDERNVVTTRAREDEPVLNGIDVLKRDGFRQLRGRKIGLITNHTGIDRKRNSTLDLLHAAPGLKLVALFGPEHGIRGDLDREGIGDTKDEKTGLPIYSLYGERRSPAPEQLEGIDTLVFDIQDIGCRFYTYAWTLVKVMQVAAGVGVAVIVADRPNPLGGAVEGPGVEPGQRTLVGLHDVPIRHGLTLGELARLADAELRIGCDLTVVRCEGWRRSERWGATGLPWVPPSPNMPTAEAAQVYPGTCLVEGTNLSVGRGTARPFEWLGAPWVDGVALAEALNRAALPGVRWRPLAFQPCAPPHASEECYGVQPHVTDADAFTPVLTGLSLVAALWQLHAGQLAWNVAHFDRLAGSPGVRTAVEAGTPAGEIAAGWRVYEAAFRGRAAPFLLYA
jgi:uncharacterized protein YbbC (DUF1343 family)